MLQQEVVKVLGEISKKHGISYKETKIIYSDVFAFLVEQFSKLSDEDPESWDNNCIVKNFGKFVVNKSKLKRYGINKKIKGEPNELSA
jgi:hypothetical protein|tara:strand:- start:264 stop:527 length:264 start_codon:yes stop_codon:yes gene_type:complete